MHRHGELGEFLLSRRARLRPEQVELRSYDDRRRVPGLRREELARLAGVSPSYYARLEQGQALNASAEVLDALARALRLDDDERDHVHALARRASTWVPAGPPVERLSPTLQQLVEAMPDVACVVTGRTGHVLLWNQLGHALLSGHLPADAPQATGTRPNAAKLVFLDPQVRALYVDWPGKARAVVEHLRLTAGQQPDDPALTSLIGELAVRSPEFSELWAGNDVGSCGDAVHELDHPRVGRLTVSQQTLRPVGHDQSLVVHLCQPGSASAAALRQLAD